MAIDFVWATERGADLVGGYAGRPPRVSEASHDLYLAQVYLCMRRELPTRARSWRSETVVVAERLLRGGGSQEKVPDAVVRDGSCRTAIEVVGQYTPEKLASFHVYCARRGVGYELW